MTAAAGERLTRGEESGGRRRGERDRPGSRRPHSLLRMCAPRPRPEPAFYTAAGASGSAGGQWGSGSSGGPAPAPPAPPRPSPSPAFVVPSVGARRCAAGFPPSRAAPRSLPNRQRLGRGRSGADSAQWVLTQHLGVPPHPRPLPLPLQPGMGGIYCLVHCRPWGPLGLRKRGVCSGAGVSLPYGWWPCSTRRGFLFQMEEGLRILSALSQFT